MGDMMRQMSEADGESHGTLLLSYVPASHLTHGTLTHITDTEILYNKFYSTAVEAYRFV
jgi:hypothetical protein